MKINAVYCIRTKEILYSRSVHDYRSSEDGKVSIDGGFEYFKHGGKSEDYISIQLDGDILLKQILAYDYSYGNGNIAKEYEDGYHGRFKITDKSNMDFYKKLIVDYKKSNILRYLMEG